MYSIDIEDTRLNTDAIETYPDEAVIEYIRLGNTQAYEIIMRRYNQRLFRAARSILKDNDSAQDAVQEAYIKAYYKLDTYIAGGNFAAWLTRITVNEALMINRKPDNRHTDKNVIHDFDTLHSSRDKPDDMLANKELVGLIEAAIDLLPDNFRSVFVLRAVQQLSLSETAHCLDIPEATVKTRYHRARNLMQKNLDQHIQSVGMRAFEFAGQRCDRIVQVVLDHIGQ